MLSDSTTELFFGKEVEIVEHRIKIAQKDLNHLKRIATNQKTTVAQLIVALLHLDVMVARGEMLPATWRKKKEQILLKAE